MAPELSVVIPAWNEAANLRVLLPELWAALAEAGAAGEVIVADTPGGDGTDAVCREHGARYVAVGRGYGRALAAGFAAAAGESVVTMDADCSHPAAFIPTLWRRRGEADLVIASRYVPGGSAAIPPARRVLSRVLNGVFRTALDLPVRDLSSGFRLYRRALLDEVHPVGRDFDVLPEIVVLAVTRGFRVLEVPFAYQPRGAGASHARLAAFAVQYARTLGRAWRLRNSIASGDYDLRAHDSRIPVQRWWQRRRCRIVGGWVAGRTRVLDVGCGSSRIAASLPPGSLGIDPGIAKLRYARRLGLAVAVGALPALPVADGAFDGVVCSQVLEHLRGSDEHFAELARVLAPGGELVLGTPDYGRLRWRLTEALYARLVPGGYAAEHVTRYDRAALLAKCGAAGFTLLDEAYVGGGELILRLRKVTPRAS